MDLSLNNIDEFTLKMFMNKTNYNKYVDNSDEIKNKEIIEFQNNIKTHKHGIIKILTEYINNPNIEMSYELDDMFYQFAKSCLKHIENKTLLEHKDDFIYSNEGYQDNIDDDILFDNIEPSKPDLDKIHTLWGKPPIKK